MRKFTFLFFLTVFLSGCATYKFDHGKTPYEKGYLAYRSNYPIPEYTIGQNNTAPDLEVAKERFKRRQKTVELYYKKMGRIESSFKEYVIGPPALIIQLVAGVFRVPFVAVSDYRAAHNPKYKEKLMQRDLQERAKEEAEYKHFKEQLNAYIQSDLSKEGPLPVKKEEAVASIEPPKESAVESLKAPSVKPAVVRPERRVTKSEGAAQLPVAVIVAKPVKGFSPLVVHFYGNRSYSPKDKIVSYSWDFGDSAVSTKANPFNTYYVWSTEPKSFTATLTVKDGKGNTATASTAIEVMNK